MLSDNLVDLLKKELSIGKVDFCPHVDFYEYRFELVNKYDIVLYFNYLEQYYRVKIEEKYTQRGVFLSKSKFYKKYLRRMLRPYFFRKKKDRQDDHLRILVLFLKDKLLNENGNVFDLDQESKFDGIFI